MEIQPLVGEQDNEILVDSSISNPSATSSMCEGSSAGPGITGRLPNWNQRFIMPIWSLDELEDLRRIPDNKRWLTTTIGQRVINVSSLISAIHMIVRNMRANFYSLPIGIAQVYVFVLKLKAFFREGFPAYQQQSHHAFFEEHRIFDNVDALMVSHYHTVMVQRDNKVIVEGLDERVRICDIVGTGYSGIYHKGKTNTQLRRTWLKGVFRDDHGTYALKNLKLCPFCLVDFGNKGDPNVANYDRHVRSEPKLRHSHNTNKRLVVREDKKREAAGEENMREDVCSEENKEEDDDVLSITCKYCTRAFKDADERQGHEALELERYPSECRGLMTTSENLQEVIGEALIDTNDMQSEWREFFYVYSLGDPQEALRVYRQQEQEFKQYNEGQRAHTFNCLLDHLDNLVETFSCDDNLSPNSSDQTSQVSGTGLFALQILQTLECSIKRNFFTFVPKLPKKPAKEDKEIGGNNGGEVTGSNNGGEVPSSNNGGEVPSSKNGGEVPSSKNGGEVPSSKNGGEVTGSNNGGEVTGSNYGRMRLFLAAFDMTSDVYTFREKRYLDSNLNVFNHELHNCPVCNVKHEDEVKSREKHYRPYQNAPDELQNVVISSWLEKTVDLQASKREDEISSILYIPVVETPVSEEEEPVSEVEDNARPPKTRSRAAD